MSRWGHYDPVATIRLPEKLASSIKRWARHNKIPGRSEAIRRLVELGLKAPAEPAVGEQPARRVAPEVEAEVQRAMARSKEQSKRKR